MTAIETEYDGITYRSRLEARWALFFDKMNIINFYEYSDIGKGYVPDFLLLNLLRTGPAIAEIKPLKPNKQYVEFLKSVRDPNKSEFYIFVGNPSFYQPEGIVIYGKGENIVQEGFTLKKCPHCGFYSDVYEGNPQWVRCFCNEFHRPESDWQSAAKIANEYRFDL